MMTDFFRQVHCILQAWTSVGLPVTSDLRLSLLRLVFMSSSSSNKKCLYFLTLPRRIKCFAKTKIWLSIRLQIRLGWKLKSIQSVCKSHSIIAVKSLHLAFLNFHGVFVEEFGYLLGEPKEMSVIIWRLLEPKSSRTQLFVKSLMSEVNSKRSEVVQIPL